MTLPDHTNPAIDYSVILEIDTEHPTYHPFRQVYFWGMAGKLCEEGYSKDIRAAATANDRMRGFRRGTTMKQMETLYDLGKSHKNRLVFLVTAGDQPKMICKDVPTAMMQNVVYRRIVAMVVE